MKVLGIIPARFNSSRFPGKPLATIGGKPMILHVIERAAECKEISKIIVATDNHTILDTVIKHGYEAMFTSENHPTGTDRCAEVLGKMEEKFDVCLNIQGDEPFLNPEQLRSIINCFQNSECQIATLKHKIEENDELFSPDAVKVLTDINSKALYFSRSPLPYLRDQNNQDWVTQRDYFRHIGLYGFKVDVLLEVSKIEESPLEKAEKLEQLRWMENGYSIFVAQSFKPNIAVDTPADLRKAENYYKSQLQG
ncbi:MAG: 3-deoxy-manno-octulosonate cytidylyltransferase (CMP-KDO synthetase) [Sphingobacteriales bacterium]|jgi:3-deoxy-manno-octulosonate cytidylyltransferase (CMP-KDO synthetase)